MKKIKAIFFDLDGTLLPMNLDNYILGYKNTLGDKALNLHINKDNFLKIIFQGLNIMIENNQGRSNEDVFWEYLVKEGLEREKIENFFLDYYINEYNLLFEGKKYNNLKEIIQNLKKCGYLIVCATNPLYPKIATLNRIKWAGLDEDDFDYITTYENSCFSKPNIKYYQHLLDKFDLKADEVLMVGNDTIEDLVFKQINGNTYLVTDYLINHNNKYVTDYKGTFEDFIYFVNNKLLK